jgi:hypothetical protein
MLVEPWLAATYSLYLWQRIDSHRVPVGNMVWEQEWLETWSAGLRDRHFGCSVRSAFFEVAG